MSGAACDTAPHGAWEEWGAWMIKLAFITQGDKGCRVTWSLGRGTHRFGADDRKADIGRSSIFVKDGEQVGCLHPVRWGSSGAASTEGECRRGGQGGEAWRWQCLPVWGWRPRKALCAD